MLLFELFSRTVSGCSAEDVTDEGILREPDDEDDEDDGMAGVFSVSYSSSSSKTPQITHQETDGQPHFPALSCANGTCNNFLLQQDPLTGSLTLLPVQIAVPQPITGADPLSTEPVKASGGSVSVTHRDSGTDIRAVLSLHQTLASAAHHGAAQRRVHLWWRPGEWSPRSGYG